MKGSAIAAGVVCLVIGVGATLHHVNHWKTGLVWIVIGAAFLVGGFATGANGAPQPARR